MTRRSAFVPAPAPPDFSARTVPQGKLEVGAAATPLYVGVHTKIPNVGDAGLYVPNTQYQATIRYGLTSGLDIGLIGTWAPWGAKVPSAYGVPPLPGGGDVLGVGLGIRGGWPLGHGLRLGFAFEAVRRFIPYAVWQCPSCNNDYAYSDATYELKETGREQFWSYAVAGVLGWNRGPLTPFLSISMVSTIRNVGFDPGTSLESTLEPGAPMAILAAGLEARLSIVRLQGMIFFPLGQEPVSYLPIAFALSVGLVL